MRESSVGQVVQNVELITGAQIETRRRFDLDNEIALVAADAQRSSGRVGVQLGTYRDPGERPGLHRIVAMGADSVPGLSQVLGTPSRHRSEEDQRNRTGKPWGFRPEQAVEAVEEDRRRLAAIRRPIPTSASATDRAITICRQTARRMSVERRSPGWRKRVSDQVTTGHRPRHDGPAGPEEPPRSTAPAIGSDRRTGPPSVIRTFVASRTVLRRRSTMPRTPTSFTSPRELDGRHGVRRWFVPSASSCTS